MRAACPSPRAAGRAGAAPDQPVAVQHRVDGADRRAVHLRPALAEPLANLRRAPGRILLLQPDDRLLDGHRQLIRVSIRAPAAVRQPPHPACAGSAARSCSRSCGRSRTRHRGPPSSRHQAGGPQTERARPRRDTPSRACLLLLRRPSVTHVSGIRCYLCLGKDTGEVGHLGPFPVHAAARRRLAASRLESSPRSQPHSVPPFANTSNGLTEVGERLPRSNVEFDTTVFTRRACSRGFCNIRRIGTSREFKKSGARRLVALACACVTLLIGSHSSKSSCSSADFVVDSSSKIATLRRSSDAQRRRFSADAPAGSCVAPTSRRPSIDVIAKRLQNRPDQRQHGATSPEATYREPVVLVTVSGGTLIWRRISSQRSSEWRGSNAGSVLM